MWANTFWGLLGIAITLAVAMIGLPREHAWLQQWFLLGAGFSLAASVLCFSWHLLRGSRKPKLHVTRFYKKKDGYSYFWYVDIQNIGRAAAKRLRFQLDGIANGPKDQSWKPLYPYDVRPEKLKYLKDWSAFQLPIDRGERVPFELFETRLSKDEHFRVVGLDSRKITRLNDSAIVIAPEEEWLLTYRVGANDTELLTFHVRIYFKDGEPFAEKVD
ncbi:MAG: hypothetical protein ACREC9_13765 [Methylocella sp.]